MIRYELMARDERNECALMAARAFYDYEYFSIYVPEDDKRKRFLDALLTCEFKANSESDKVRFLVAKENEKNLAVAQLCAPGFDPPSDMAYIKSGWLRVVRTGGSKDVSSWHEMEKLAESPCHELEGNIWYLSLLTVDKSAEGRGVGTAFINEGIIPYVEEQGAEALSLFTNSEINRKFYKKNGFTEFDEKQFSYKGKTIGSWSYIKKI